MRLIGVTRARTGRARGTRRLGPWPLAGVLGAVGLAYVALRLWSVLSVHEVWGAMPDSAGYRDAVAGGGARVGFGGGAPRPWTVPAIYAVLPGDGVRAGAQVLVSIGAWSALATAVARQVVRPFLALVAFLAILVLSLVWGVILWDLAILAESLALSLAVASIAAWLVHLRSPTWPSAVAVVVVSTLWAFTRVQHVPVVALLASVAVVLALRVRSGARPVWVATAAGLVLVCAWSASTLGTQDRSYASRDGLGVSLFGETFALNLRFTILPDPEALAWFRANGMPEPQGLEPYRRVGTIHVDAWDTWPEYYAAYRADAPLRDWVESDGRGVFSRFVATHSPLLVRRFGSEVGEVLVPPASSLGYAFPAPILPAPVAAVVAPESGRPGVSPVVWLPVAIVATVAARRRLPPNRLLAGVGAFVAVASVPALFLAWLGSPVEYTRHAIPFSVLLPLGLGLVLVAAWDAPAAGAVAADVPDDGLRPGRPHP